MSATTHPARTTPTTPIKAADARRTPLSVLAGRVLTGAVLALLTLDAVGKLVRPDAVVEATVESGFQTWHVPVIGVLLLVGVVAHAVPRTSFLGAVWLTAYLGGAVCTNLRLELPLATHVLSGVYVAVAMWAGFYLRSPRLRALVRSGH